MLEQPSVYPALQPAARPTTHPSLAILQDENMVEFVGDNVVADLGEKKRWAAAILVGNVASTGELISINAEYVSMREGEFGGDGQWIPEKCVTYFPWYRVETVLE